MGAHYSKPTAASSTFVLQNPAVSSIDIPIQFSPNLTSKTSRRKRYPTALVCRGWRAEQEVTKCYLNNLTRPLDCWQQVQAFKNLEKKALRDFVVLSH
ncbi:hypothetical protein BASA84_000325 [Batrachochytrium salamandrivorans]|nr:hypothetical protein BASA84_000325 [Batrachochytrium salamandrivorans]